LSDVGYDPAFGARPLRRAIQQYLEDPLSDHLIGGDFGSGDTIVIEINESKDGLTFQKDVPDENSKKSEKELDPFAELERNTEEENTEQTSVAEESDNLEDGESQQQKARTETSEEGDDESNQEDVENENKSEEEEKKPSFLNKVFKKRGGE
jgi:ATP-dependent Clp protease ATP-binding subunit ClpC